MTTLGRTRVRRSNKAITLIEVLVSIAVIGVIAALSGHAIQAAREAANRVHCNANLRQIGIAMNNYYAVHQMFPPSQLKTGSHWSTNNMSEFSFLLPYLEQGILYSSINFDFASLESVNSPTLSNRTVRNTSIGVFLCPSDREPYHLCSYRFNRGRLGGKWPRRGHDGPFGILALPTHSAITDGLSSTSFVSERIAGTFIKNINDKKRDIKYPIAYNTIFSRDSDFIPYCLSSPALRWGYTAGRYWMISSFSDTHYNHNGIPNDPRTTCSMDISSDNGFGLHPPRSYHPGLVNVLLGDGNVRAVENTINLKVWTALGTHDQAD